MSEHCPPALDVAGRLISWAARQHGDRPSVLFRQHSFSHWDIEERSNRMANAFIALGLGPGDRVAVLLENSIESIDSVFGADKAALTYVALNVRHTLNEHLEVLKDAQACAVVIGPQYAEIARALIETAAGSLPHLRFILGLGLESVHGVTDLAGLCAQAEARAPHIPVAPEHIVRISYTSGTTGRPKGVVYTHERMLQRLNNHFLSMEYALSVDDAMLHVGPLTHAAGVYVFPCFLRGARNVVLDRFDPASLLQAIEQHRITQLMLVPTMMSRLVDAIEGGLRGDWSSLRRIHYGTAPTPAGLLRRAVKIFGPVLRQQYGMTEAVQPLCVLYPHEHLAKSDDDLADPLASCGKPSANVRITLRDAQGNIVPSGSVGEIALAHEGATRVSYWRRPDLLAQTVRGGWFYTGDLGRFDAQGFLYIVGRNKDMIISGGFNVYAREVEDVLNAHPAVLESAVVGLPHPEWGEQIAAAVVLRAEVEVTTDQIMAHCSALMAGYKKPRRLLCVDALPRNLASKVLKDQVKALFTTVRDGS